MYIYIYIIIYIYMEGELKPSNVRIARGLRADCTSILLEVEWQYKALVRTIVSMRGDSINQENHTGSVATQVLLADDDEARGLQSHFCRARPRDSDDDAIKLGVSRAQEIALRVALPVYMSVYIYRYIYMYI